MMLQNFSIEPDPNPANPGNYILKGDFYDTNTKILHKDIFGTDGTSLFEWWATKSDEERFKYINEFAWMIISDKVYGNQQ